MDDASSNVGGGTTSTRDVCDVDGCVGMAGVTTWNCQRDECPHVVHHVCAVDILHCEANTYFCSVSCMTMATDAASTPPSKIVPGVEFTTFEELQSAIREDGARFGVKINQRQTHLMDDRALVIFGHKSIQRGVFYCSQLHCPYTLRFSYDFGKMRYSIRHSSFHGTHNHGIKNTVHARGKDIPFDNEFTSMEAHPDGIERFQCRHCRAVVLKRTSRLSHLKDCLPYRGHLGLGHALDDADDSDEAAWSSRPGSAEFRFLPSDGQASSRLECIHCSAQLNAKSNRLLTHLRDCAAYQSGQPSADATITSQGSGLDDVLPTSAATRPTSATTSTRLDCRPLNPDTDIRATQSHLGLSSATTAESTGLDRRYDHWGLFDPCRPAKRMRSGHAAPALATPHMIGRFSLDRLHMNVGGARVPVGLVHSVTTDWLHPGATTSCLAHAVRVCHAQNHALALVPGALLHDAKTAAAARAMGFTALPSWFEHTFARSALLSQDATYPRHLLAILDESEDSSDVVECLGRVGAARHGRLFRSMDAATCPWPSPCHRLVGCRDLRGTLRGFFVSELDPASRKLLVHDIVYEDARILGGLLGFLATQDHADTIVVSTPDPHFLRLLRHPPTATAIAHPPPLVARIVHVGQFFASHITARNFNFATGIILQLVVQDAGLPPHTSTSTSPATSLILRFDGGLVRVLPTSPEGSKCDARLQLNLEALAALVLGTVPLVKLVQWGQAQVTPSDPRTTRLLARAFEVDEPPAARVPL